MEGRDFTGIFRLPACFFAMSSSMGSARRFRRNTSVTGLTPSAYMNFAISGMHP